MKRVAVLLADGFEEVEAVTPVDFLRRAGIDAITAGVVSRDVTGSHNLRVTADTTIAELPGDLDGVVLPGGSRGAEGIASSPAAMALIGSLLEGGKLVAAICASPGVVLGAHGLLEGRSFTCYPGFESRALSGTFVEKRVVSDRNLLTSRAPGTAAEFAEAIIAYLVGPDAAKRVHDATLQQG